MFARSLIREVTRVFGIVFLLAFACLFGAHSSSVHGIPQEAHWAPTHEQHPDWTRWEVQQAQACAAEIRDLVAMLRTAAPVSTSLSTLGRSLLDAITAAKTHFEQAIIPEGRSISRHLRAAVNLARKINVCIEACKPLGRIANSARRVQSLLRRTDLLLLKTGALPVPPPVPPEPKRNSWDNCHKFTGFPLTEDGWTDLAALYQHPDLYLDSRVVYVSSTEGDDGTAIVYRPGDPEIGAEPFSVETGILPFATLSSALQHVRHGYPDIMLLKRGDTWDESLHWKLSGRAVNEPIILGCYGSLSSPRPTISRLTTYYGETHPHAAFDHLVTTGLTFTGGLTREIGGSNWLIEDCACANGSDGGFVIQGLGPTALKNVAIRRCIVVGMRTTGIFATSVDGLLVEETLLDRNGLNSQGDGPSLRIHNAYLTSSNRNVIFRSNISARASSHGVHQRPGGLMEGNLFLQNPLVQFGYSHTPAEDFGPFSGIVRNNVILDSRDIGDAPRAFGLRLEALRGAEVYGNVIAHQRSGTANAEAISFGHFSSYLQCGEDITIRNNVVYNWQLRGGGIGIVFRQPTSTTLKDIRVTNNTIVQDADLLVSIPSEALAAFTFSGNSYYSGNPAPFHPGKDFLGWMEMLQDNGSAFIQPVFPDPHRDITSYARALGLSGESYEAALDQFLSEASLQRRGYWRTPFTADAACRYFREGFGLPLGGL